MIATVRWTSFALAIVCLVALGFDRNLWVAVIFAVAFLVHVATYVPWAGVDPDPDALTSLDERDRSRRHPG